MPGVLDSYKEAAAKVGFDKTSDFRSTYVRDAKYCVAKVIWLIWKQKQFLRHSFGFNSILILLLLFFSCRSFGYLLINHLRNVRDVSLKRKLTKRLVEGGETKRIGDNKLLIARLLSFKVSGTISGISFAWQKAKLFFVQRKKNLLSTAYFHFVFWFL